MLPDTEQWLGLAPDSDEMSRYSAAQGLSFLQWASKRTRSEAGFKLHVSAHPDDAATVCRAVLPALRTADLLHKVVISPERYRALCAGAQAGKLITLYLSSRASAVRIAAGLDRMIYAAAARAPLRIAPWPRERLAGGDSLAVERRDLEEPFGFSGHVFGRAYTSLHG